MSYLDELYRAHAEKAGIIYVDIWDGFVDEQGRFAVQGPDFQGQIRRLRTPDGVHFTKAGAVKLASYVDRELRRVMNHVRAGGAAGSGGIAAAETRAAARCRPGAAAHGRGAGRRGDLLGAGGHPAQATADPVAAKVFSRGDPIPAPAGRADDFSWPRPGADANAAPDVPPQPVSLAPATPAKKGAEPATTARNQPTPRRMRRRSRL